MNPWLDTSLIVFAVLASVAYAAYALGPKRLKKWVVASAVRLFGLRALQWFGATTQQSGCNTCGSREEHKELGTRL